jgi:hypothetical protein
MSQQGGAKRPYVKPDIEEVRLVAEEAVLQGCKQDNGGPTMPAWGGGCNPKTGPFTAMCNQAGS